MVSQRQGVNGVCLILYENGPEEHWHDQPPKASAVPDNVKESSSSVDASTRQQGTHGNHPFFHQSLRSRRCWRRISCLCFDSVIVKYVCFRRPPADIESAVAKLTSARPSPPSPSSQLFLEQHNQDFHSAKTAWRCCDQRMPPPFKATLVSHNVKRRKIWRREETLLLAIHLLFAIPNRELD